MVLRVLLGALAGVPLGFLAARYTSKHPVDAAVPHPERRPILVALTLVLGAFVAAQSWSWPVIAAWIAFVPVAVALAVIDLEHKRLPDALTLRYLAMGLPLLVIGAVVDGDASSMRGALLGAVGLFVFYFALNLVSRGGMGMGDVKLALSIGALTGYFGWAHTVGATVIAFLAGSAVSVVLLLARKANRKSRVPFGPFMLLGAFAIVPLASAFASLFAF